MVSARLLSSGIIPVYFFRDEPNRPSFLLLRAYKYWDFPKGIVEAGEDPRTTAVRELCEETNISEVSFPWGENFFETEPYSRNKVARYYLGKVSVSEVKLMRNPVTGIVEHQEFRWCEYGKAAKLVGARVLEVLNWAHKRLKTGP